MERKKNVKESAETFRQWLDRRGLTLQSFVQSVPGVSYGIVSKWAMKNPPRKIHALSRMAVAAVYPDCPIANPIVRR